jgi:hypothetical protein
VIAARKKLRYRPVLERQAIYSYGGQVMSNEYRINSGCEECDTDGLRARIAQLEDEVLKLVSLVEGQRGDITNLKSRIATIKALAMDAVGTRKVK